MNYKLYFIISIIVFSISITSFFIGNHIYQQNLEIEFYKNKLVLAESVIEDLQPKQLDRYGYPAEWERNYDNCLKFDDYPDCPDELISEISSQRVIELVKEYPDLLTDTEADILISKIIGDAHDFNDIKVDIQAYKIILKIIQGGLVYCEGQWFNMNNYVGDPIICITGKWVTL